MTEKPLLVIIGEAHPPGIEQAFEMSGRIKTKTKEVRGVKRLVIDSSKEPERSAANLRRINEEIIKREAQILKEEKVTRLFYEEPANAERKKLYAEFKKTHDLTHLKAGLRKEMCRMDAQLMKDIDRLLVEIDLWEPLLEGARAMMRKSERAQHMLSVSPASVAHRAGIFEIAPFEDELLHRKATALIECWGILKYASNWLLDAPEAADIRKKYGGEIDKKIGFEIFCSTQAIKERKQDIHEERERAACRNILEDYVPGSAVICGLLHADSLGKLLAKKFRVKVYLVGKELGEVR